MEDSTKYNRKVSWGTLVKNVILLSEETVTDPATYRVSVHPVDANEPGALLPIEVGYYLEDFGGSKYVVIAVGAGTIDVKDDFRSGLGPTTGMRGVVYESVADGDSPFIAPIDRSHLDKSALDNSRAKELDALWKKLYDEAYILDPEQWKRNVIDASVKFSVSIGLDNKLFGEQSLSLSTGGTTRAFRETVLGSYGLDTAALSATTWNVLDLLLSVGNGSDNSHQSNAIEVFKSGLIKLYNGLLIGKYDHGSATPTDGMLSMETEGLRIWYNSRWNKLGRFPYTAYASDNIGTGFSLTDVTLPYMAILVSDTEIFSPVVGDFTGLWRSGGSSGASSYIDLTDTSDTTYTGKDKYVPVVNEGTGKLDLTPSEVLTGATGSFTTVDGQTVTVVDGIITLIV